MHMSAVLVVEFLQRTLAGEAEPAGGQTRTHPWASQPVYKEGKWAGLSSWGNGGMGSGEGDWQCLHRQQ